MLLILFEYYSILQVYAIIFVNYNAKCCCFLELQAKELDILKYYLSP